MPKASETVLDLKHSKSPIFYRFSIKQAYNEPDSIDISSKKCQVFREKTICKSLYSFFSFSFLFELSTSSIFSISAGLVSKVFYSLEQ